MNGLTIGIDEVGRGCLAGPMVIGLVSLSTPINGLKDSKLLSKKKRQSLYGEIFLMADIALLAWVWPHEIDELGLTLSMTLAIKRGLAQMSSQPTDIIIDGNTNYLPDNPAARTVIGADKTIPQVSAASIIAKVARDNYMEMLNDYLPEYDFASNVGYGTKNHLQAIKLKGPSTIHRLSFAPMNSYLEKN
ncbi:MAG TPA: ribonuclease HII [Candidatus Saccharimonadales bacterium]